MVTTPMEPVCSAEPNSPLPLFEQIAQVQLQPAAHGTDHVRAQLGIDEILEIGQAVLGGHLEQQFGVVAAPSGKSSVML